MLEACKTVSLVSLVVAIKSGSGDVVYPIPNVGLLEEHQRSQDGERKRNEKSCNAKWRARHSCWNGCEDHESLVGPQFGRGG